MNNCKIKYNYSFIQFDNLTLILERVKLHRDTLLPNLAFLSWIVRGFISVSKFSYCHFQHVHP